MKAQDRTILVTGSSSGIGRATCERLLKAGYGVVGLARDHSKFVPDHPDYVPIALDLSQTDTLVPSLRRILKERPEIDGVVSNAGHGLFGSIESFSAQDIRAYFDLALLSHVLLSHVVVPHLKAKRRGDLIFMGSESALKGARQGSLYCAAKFALRGLCQSLRAECGRRGVRVSLINPGMVRTPFFESLNFRPRAGADHAILPDDVAGVVAMILSARQGTVIDEINLSPQSQVIDFD